MIPYVGGKSKLARWIISQFPSNYKDLTYCEVFGGGGWVLYKKELSRLEIYNDLNGDLVNLFQVIRDQFDEFKHRVEWTLHSREMYRSALLSLSRNGDITKMDRAILTAIRYVQSFSGKDGWTHLLSSSTTFKGKWTPFFSRIEKIRDRLQNVQIECLDFERCITKYDSKNTLFYIDPPYIDREHYYNTKRIMFASKDHERLATILHSTKGKFILSYYDEAYIRKLYRSFRIIQMDVKKSSFRVSENTVYNHQPNGQELLIMNY